MSATGDDLRPVGGLLLSASSCAVIATELARELRGVVAYSSPLPEIVDRVTDDRLLTADQVADRLSATPRAVYDFARRQTDPLPVVKLGRVRRFRPLDVDAWIERQR